MRSEMLLRSTVLRSVDEIDELAHFGMVGSFVEEVEEIEIKGFGSEMDLDKMIYSGCVKVSLIAIAPTDG
jgi:hypothetical protein